MPICRLMTFTAALAFVAIASAGCAKPATEHSVAARDLPQSVSGGVVNVILPCAPIETLTGPMLTGSFGRRPISVDGKDIDGIRPCEARTVKVTPGTHEVQIGEAFLGLGAQPGSLTVRDGVAAFIIVNPKNNRWAEVSAEIGRSEIAKMPVR